MSNRVDPKLNTILDPLPKINNIKPLNLRSKNFDSFPPLPTPKLQPLNKDAIKFVGLRNIPVDKKVSKKEIKKQVKKIKKEIKEIKMKEPSFIKNISQFALYFFISIIIFTLIMFFYKKK